MNQTVIFISLLVVVFIYFIHKSTQVCNGDDDCTLYNSQDKKSSCDPICENLGKVYNGYKNGKCNCEQKIQLKPLDEHIIQNPSKNGSFVADIELYTNTNDETTILPYNVPDDILFHNRDILEKHQKTRFSSLIFG